MCEIGFMTCILRSISLLKMQMIYTQFTELTIYSFNYHNHIHPRDNSPQKLHQFTPICIKVIYIKLNFNSLILFFPLS